MTEPKDRARIVVLLPTPESNCPDICPFLRDIWRPHTGQRWVCQIWGKLRQDKRRSECIKLAKRCGEIVEDAQPKEQT